MLTSPSRRKLHSAHCDYEYGTPTAYLNTEYTAFPKSRVCLHSTVKLYAR